MGRADTNAVRHIGQARRHRLHLRRVHLIAAHIDHIVRTSDQVKAAFRVDLALVMGEEDTSLAQDGGRLFRIVHIARHQHGALASHGAVGRDPDAGVLHRPAQTSRYAAAGTVEVVGADNAGLGGRIRVIEAGMGQDPAQLFHVFLTDRGGAGLDEVYDAGIGRKFPATEGQQHADGGRD